MTEPPPITQKERTWLACKEKACCHAPFVIPTGRDIWRIARALDTPAWSFVVYFQAPQPRRDAFLLESGGPLFRLALGKGSGRRRQGLPPCIFLLRTRQGHRRCALGTLRPLVCRAFPSDLNQGIVQMQPQTGCTCRDWALTDVDIAEEAALVRARQADAAEYCAVAGRWNARVTGAPTGSVFTFFDYCEFLLAAYDALEATRAAGSTP